MRVPVLLLLVLLQTASSVAPRRRAVRPVPPAPCTRPTLFLTLSRSAICSGDSVTLSWHASDAQASVSIIGVGEALPSSGSKTTEPSTSITYSGRATNTCGPGNDAVAEVKVLQGGSASLSSSSYSIQQGQSTTLTVTVSNVNNWTLASSFGNALSASFGNASRTVTYTGTYAGIDTVTLTAFDACGPRTSSISITVSAPTPPPPPPPPTSGGLRCCDGTFSPTCNNCAKKTGCCSGHNGVCGC